MPLTSMTGFARVEGEAGLARWHWELRSVNGKGLDVRFRLPPGLDAIEPKLRAELARHLKRGNCQASLTVDRSAAPAPLRVNTEALRVVLDAIAELRRDIEMKPPQPEGILALRGVLESADVAEESGEVRQAFEDAIVVSFGEAAAALARARAEEGASSKRCLALMSTDRTPDASGGGLARRNGGSDAGASRRTDRRTPWRFVLAFRRTVGAGSGAAGHQGRRARGD